MTAAIYLRVSSDGQTGGDRYGLATQERECRAYAERSGLRVARVYRDVVTGTSTERSGFNELLADVDAYQHVVVYALDRLARTVPAAYSLATRLLGAGVQLHSATEDVMNPGDGVAFGLHAVIADAERRRITARMAEGKVTKVASGKPLRPVWAFGFVDGAIHEPEAAVVRALFGQALALGGRELQRWAETHGLRTRAGAPFDRATLRAMLRNPLYRGEYVYRRGRADAVSCAVPAIVAPELWHAVQRQMNARTTGSGRRGNRSHIYPLTGRIFCHVCGAAAVGIYSYGRRGHAHEPYRYYRCGDRARQAHTRTGCTHVTQYRIEGIHAAVWDALRELRDRPDTVDAILVRPSAEPVDVSELLADVDSQLRRARQAYLKGIDSEDEYAATKRDLDARRDGLLTLGAAGRAQPPADPARARLALVQALGQDDLAVIAANLGLRVTVEPGGGLHLALDPA